MIDFVAKSYEENRFNPDKAIVRSLSLSKGRGKLYNYIERHIRHIAGIAAAVIVGIFLYTSWRASWTDYMAYDIPQTFTLPDSSSVTLAPGATLRLQRHKDNRLVQMTGKIYFNVRHDDRAPFRIVAGSGFVKVLGTRFQVDAHATSVAEPVEATNPVVRQGSPTMVRQGSPTMVRQSSPASPAGLRKGSGHFGKLSDRRADSISVNVVSGKVLFSATRSGEEGLILTKGQSAVLRQGSSAPTRLTPKHPNPTAWATGEFIYDNTPLPEVLSELSEYYGVTLVMSDAESRSLSGEFSTSSLPEILNLINSALGTDIRIKSQPTR